MSLLDDAIVDAIALKEAALKNAEAMVLEKYSVDVKDALERLLNEQEDLGAAPAPAAGLGLGTTTDPNTGATVEKTFVDDIPFAFSDRNMKGVKDKEKLCDGQPCPEDEEQIEIPLKNIAEALNIQLKAKVDNSNKFEINKEELLDVYESLTVDAKVVPHGHVYLATSAEIEHANDLANAKKVQLDKEREEEYGKIKKENKSLKGRVVSYEEKLKELATIAEALANKVENYENAVNTLQEKLENLSLSNAKLLYKNRVLGNASLNERQKERIVGSLTNVKSIEEAKVIYETLQSSTQSQTNGSGPKSLSEAIERNSSSISSRVQNASVSSPAIERMKTLAGIKTK
jgi:hypothetical protein